MRITLKAFLLAGAVSFTWPAETQACGCAPIVAVPGVTPSEPAVVVLATATRVIRTNSGQDRIHFEVLETLRGSLGSDFEYEQYSNTTCAMAFSPGSAYLLYGTPADGTDGRVVGANVQFDKCGRSRRATFATDQDLRRLRAVAEGREPTRVHGYVLLDDDDPTSGRTLFAPVWTNVILEGPETFATVLDGAILRDGYFEFNDVPLGTYRLWVPRATITGQRLGLGRTYVEPSEIEVKDGTPVTVVVKVRLAPASAPVQ